MRYALATWNFAWDDAQVLLALLDDMAAWGFDVASFHPQQLQNLSGREQRTVADRLSALDLGATIHGNCAQTPESIAETAALFGPRLLTYTFDAAMEPDSRGWTYNAGCIARVLATALETTAPVNARVAMEDFPLDVLAVETFSNALGEVLVHPRAGILIDLGHMNLRRTQGRYFGDRSIDAYLSRVPLPIIELHVHDNDGTKDAHRHLGEGTLPLAPTAAAVAAHAPDAIQTIEVAPTLHGADPADEREGLPTTLRVWRRALAGAAMDA